VLCGGGEFSRLLREDCANDTFDFGAWLVESPRLGNRQAA
jgi:hypothetical protein